MDAQIQSDITATTNHLPFEVVALVLQGGGALGADQAGVYEALSGGGHPSEFDRRHGDRRPAADTAVVPPGRNAISLCPRGPANGSAAQCAQLKRVASDADMNCENKQEAGRWRPIYA